MSLSLSVFVGCLGTATSLEYGSYSREGSLQYYRHDGSPMSLYRKWRNVHGIRNDLLAKLHCTGFHGQHRTSSLMRDLGMIAAVVRQTWTSYLDR